MAVAVVLLLVCRAIGGAIVAVRLAVAVGRRGIGGERPADGCMYLVLDCALGLGGFSGWVTV